MLHPDVDARHPAAFGRRFALRRIRRWARPAGLCLLLALSSPPPAHAGTVSLDPTFAGDGAVALAASTGNDADEALALALDAHGRIVAAGYSSTPRQQMTVMRLAPDGAPDGSFGGVGVVALDVGVRARAQALALQDDGKIVVAGFAVLIPSGIEQFVAARLLEDGTLDPGFGGGGVVAIAFGTRDARALALALDGDGRVVLAGWARNSANRDVALARLTADGTLDASFGVGGKLTFAVGTGNDEAATVALDAEGRIVLAGYAADGSSYDFLVARRTARGDPDPTFNATGARRVSTADGVEQANALLLQPDGRILLVGQGRIDGSYRIAAARVGQEGLLDPTFGGGGIVVTAIGELAEAKAVAATTRDRFVVAGRARLAGGVLRFVVARYLATGALDVTFGDRGSLQVAIGSKSDEGYAVAVDDQNRIVVAGTARSGNNPDFGFARLVVDDCGDGFLDPGEQCDGGAEPSCCTTSCTFAPAGTVCRVAADACDLEDLCDGVAGDCPPDDVLPDGDDDGVCDEQDLCPLDPDPLQLDGDGDGLGDACDPCTGGVALERMTMRFGGLQTPDGDDTVKIVGSITLPNAAVIAPRSHGARVLIHASDGSLLFDARIPPGTFDAEQVIGWKVSRTGRLHKFRSGEPIAGLVRRVRIARAVTPGRYHLKVVGSGLDLSQQPLFGALQVTIVADPATPGRCGELVFAGPEHACALNEGQTALVCR